MFVEIRIKKVEDHYRGDILYNGKKINDNTLVFANLIQRKLTSNKVVLQSGIYMNYYSNRQTMPTSSHDMVYIDRIEGASKEDLLDDIYRFATGTNNLDIKVPLVIKVGKDEFVYHGDNVISFISIEQDVVKKLALEK